MARRAIPWTPAEDATLLEMQAAGNTWDEISRVVTTHSSESARSRYMRISTGLVTARVPVIEPEEKEALEKASVEARVKELEKKLCGAATGFGDRVPMETDAELPTDPADSWAHAEVDSARRIKFYHDRTRFSVDFDKTDPGLPIGVSFISDQHISPGNLIDFRRLRLDAELIAEAPGLYACLGGDGVDNHIAIRSAGLAARSQPHEQWQLYEYYLGIFAPKIMAMISGNHDAWTDQIAGVDMVHMLAQRQRICYSPSEARITANVGGQAYRIAIRHQYRFGSSLNLTHCVKRWWDMGEEDFDAGTICHDHEAECNSFFRHGLERWAFRPGAYQIGSSFVRQYGWNETRPTCPTLILWPGERKMTGFNDVRIAAAFLKSERGGR